MPAKVTPQVFLLLPVHMTIMSIRLAIQDRLFLCRFKFMVRSKYHEYVVGNGAYRAILSLILLLVNIVECNERNTSDCDFTLLEVSIALNAYGSTRPFVRNE